MTKIWSIWFGYFIISILAYGYVRPEVDQLEKAILFAPIYSLMPFLVLFAIILYILKLDTNDHRLLKVLTVSLGFALASGPAALLINMHCGQQRTIMLSGVVLEKKIGRGNNSKPSIIIKCPNEFVRLSVSRRYWNSAVVGDEFSIDLKEGSLGLYYLKGE